MKISMLVILLFVTSVQVALAGDKYYLTYTTKDGQYVKYGPMSTLQACQEDMAKFMGKFGRSIINPVCIKQRK